MSMGSRRQTQVSETIAHLAADYFARQSNGTSLMTVTHANISPDLKNATIYLSVLPTAMEESALHFAKRSRTDFREYVKKNGRFKFLPHFDFELDYGEKNRQRIDKLTR